MKFKSREDYVRAKPKRKDLFLALFSNEERSNLLIELANNFFIEDMWISVGCELSFSRRDLLKFSVPKGTPDKFKDLFVVFGQATHSGSSYAFYKTKNSKNCNEWPVVVLGDEGGVLVITKDIFDLFRFWTLQVVQPYITTDYNTNKYEFDLFVDEEALSELEENGMNNDDFKHWIKNKFQLESMHSIQQVTKEIIKPAQELYQEEIDALFKNY